MIRYGVLLVMLAASTGCSRMESRSLTKEGNALYRAGKYRNALERYDQAAALDEKYALVQLHRGYAALALASGATAADEATRFNQSAIEAFSRYMKLNSRDERGPRYYLQVLIDTGQWDKAEAFLLARHREHPKNVEVISTLGALNSKAGRFEKALTWYERQAALEQKEPKPSYLIGTLCWQHLHKNAAVAHERRIVIANRGITALKHALSLRTDHIEALTYLNLLFRERALGQADPQAQAADLQQAQRYYERALKLNAKEGS
jgi:tetratricopeptide (TPR) repeat protein